MKKIFILLLFIVTLPIYSLSVSDLSLIYEPTGEYISFYDKPLRFFEIVGEPKKIEDFKWGQYFSEYYKNNKFEIRIWRGLNMKINYHTFDFYKFSDINVFADFITTRGIRIGSSIENVVKKYPEAKLGYTNCNFKQRREKEGYVNDLFWYNSIPYSKNIDLKKYNCVMIYDYMQENARACDIENSDALIYCLVFYFDKNKNVDEIQINFVVTKA